MEKRDKALHHLTGYCKYLCFILSIMAAAAALTGCGEKNAEKMRVVLTTGFGREEVFRLDRTSCTLPEVMVYLTNTQNQYEAVFGEEIWEKDLNGANLESSIKENVLARIAQIKAMNLLAGKHAITLDEKELELSAKAAAQYYDSLNNTEIEKMGVNEELIRNLYEEYALANKVYDDIIKDINPEISDDEARTITVQQVLLKTYTLNGKGEKTALSESEKEKIFQKAQMIDALAKEGADFSKLIEEYSDDKVGTYSYGKGEMEASFEKTTFELGKDEVSDVIESEYGYHIVKCISTFDRDETDANKVKIVEQRKKEVFNEEYNEFLATLTKNLNKKLWADVTFIQDENVKTKDFFDVYNKYFGESE